MRSKWPIFCDETHVPYKMYQLTRFDILSILYEVQSMIRIENEYLFGHTNEYLYMYETTVADFFVQDKFSSKSCTCRKSMTHSNWGAIKIELISLCKAIEILKQPRMNYLFPPVMHRRTRFDCPTFKCVYEMTQTWKYVYTGIVTWPIFEHFLKFQCRA